NLLLERLPISRQRHNRRVELQPVVRPQQGLEQPAAKEPRSSRDEEARTAKAVPQSARPCEHVIQIASQGIAHRHALTTSSTERGRRPRAIPGIAGRGAYPYTARTLRADTRPVVRPPPATPWARAPTSRRTGCISAPPVRRWRTRR